MNTSCQILPGVKAIYSLDGAKLLPNVALRGICGMDCPILTDLMPLEIFGEPECSCSTSKTNGQNSDTVTLKFLTHFIVPFAERTAFVVTDVEGRSYLIGSKEPPYPQVNFTRRFGSPDGDAAGYLYEITHIALKSLIPCSITVE